MKTHFPLLEKNSLLPSNYYRIIDSLFMTMKMNFLFYSTIVRSLAGAFSVELKDLKGIADCVRFLISACCLYACL